MDFVIISYFVDLALWNFAEEIHIGVWNRRSLGCLPRKMLF